MSTHIPNFNQTELAFKYKTTTQLQKTHFVFKLFNYPFLVKFLSGGAALILKYKLPGKFLIKQTVFKVFCAGENLHQAFITIGNLMQYKVKSVLDYVSESENNQAGYKQNAIRIKQNINALAIKYPGHYISIKITGLEDYDFLKRSNFLLNEKSSDNKVRFNQLLTTIDEICAEAHAHNITIYFDAEERCTQDIYDYIVEQMMQKYNTKKAVIFNTLQMYLTDRIVYLNNLIALSKKNNFYAGVKIVRGAYHEKENERAEEAGVPSPVFKTKADTDKSFDMAIDICLANMQTTHLCIASHNEESITHAIAEVNRLNIADAKEKISFSQLLGMSDNLTFNLAHAGFEVSKYLPYGEIEKAIPYLIRRANENKTVNGQMNRELELITKEVKRRRETNA
ncbi:MAG: proline dehydrogenase family protein [Bacteroidia bacterium]|nr:proline dehydrogenase family protein [Bacteroidia bacterium]MBP9688070.1 proline dehydrogenase family protein [Bacteroidia bacterium]